MHVSQIFISDTQAELPPYLSQSVETIRRGFPTLRHVLYNQQSMRQVLIDNFDSEVVAAYDKFRPYSYKADLGRYCLLYAMGGWYFDIAIRLIMPITLHDNLETLAFRDLPFSGTSWSISASVLYAKKGSPVFQTAIQTVVENCKNEYYGINAVCPTGPVLLGAAFAANGPNANRVFGDLQYLTPNHANKNPAFVLPDGLILALAKPGAGMTGGDLKGFGALGTNDYNEFYRSRTVYKSDT